MPDRDDPTATGPEAGSPGPHPVLEDMTEAVRLTGDAAAFLSPTRMFDEPGLDEDDWPQDLDGPQTRQMLGHLADIADHADTCLNGIGCQQIEERHRGIASFEARCEEPPSRMIEAKPDDGRSTQLRHRFPHPQARPGYRGVPRQLLGLPGHFHARGVCHQLLLLGEHDHLLPDAS